MVVGQTGDHSLSFHTSVAAMLLSLTKGKKKEKKNLIISFYTRKRESKRWQQENVSSAFQARGRALPPRTILARSLLIPLAAVDAARRGGPSSGLRRLSVAFRIPVACCCL